MCRWIGETGGVEYLLRAVLLSGIGVLVEGGLIVGNTMVLEVGEEIRNQAGGGG